MAYSTNIYLPNVRRRGVNLVLLSGWSCERVARHLGVHRTTVWRWLKLPGATDQRRKLVTRSSRPHSCPHAVTRKVIERILALRWQLKRCGAVIHAVLLREGITVSLASVGRILARHKQTVGWYGQPGKQQRRRIPRPKVGHPGSFMQMDTIHFSNWQTGERYYVYTLIDLRSRWAYAAYSPRISPEITIIFVRQAQAAAAACAYPFTFLLIQTDNGQEFGRAAEASLATRGIIQRRIRLGRKNDNAHIERFNRTLQDECLGRWPAIAGIQARLVAYLDFYNTKRLHLGVQCKAPSEVLRRW